MTDKTKNARDKYLDKILRHAGASKDLDAIFQRLEKELAARGIQHKAFKPTKPRRKAAPTPPPVIENQSQRLALKAQKLGVSMEVHAQLLQMLGPDVVETVYNNALPSTPNPDAYVPKLAPTGGQIDRTIKALTTREELQLVYEKAASVGLPEPLTVAMARRLGHDALKQIIERLGSNRFFGTKALAPRKPRGPTIEIDPLFRVQVINFDKGKKRP